MNIKRCRLCHNNARGDVRFDTEEEIYNCEGCGSYQVSSEAIQDYLENADDELRSALRYSIRNTNKKSNRPMVLTTTLIPQLLEEYRTLKKNPQLKVGLLLEDIHDRSEYLGHLLRPEPSWCDYCGATNFNELRFLLEHLQSKNFLTYNFPDVQLTLDGFEFLRGHSGAVPIKGRVFLAKSFDDSLDDVYVNGYFPSLIGDCGLELVYLKGKLDFEGKICDQILAEIRKAECVVVDVTGNRPNVHFEAGFAVALNKTVVWTAQEGTEFHFDSRQYPHLIWRDAANLRSQLTAKFEAIGKSRKSSVPQ